MIRQFLILAPIVILSSIYAVIVKSYPVELIYTVYGVDLDLSSPNIYTYHVVLFLFDLFAIYLLTKYKVRILTNWLVLLLSLSIINQTVGAFAFVAYNDPGLAVYDLSRIIILALEVMAFTLYGLYNLFSRPYNNDSRVDAPGFLVVESYKCD